MKSDKVLTVDELITRNPCRDAITLLREKLPENVCYHTLEHTLDVTNEALRFAQYDSLKPREIELLGIAAVFHDTGFTYSLKANEALGAKFAADALAECPQYKEGEVALITTMILDTQVKVVEGAPRQIPTTELSKYLLDADVSNLGREDFFQKAALVREELALDDEALFFSGVSVFINAHTWYTPAAQALRQEQKLRNIIELEKKIAANARKLT